MFSTKGLASRHDGLEKAEAPRLTCAAANSSTSEGVAPQKDKAASLERYEDLLRASVDWLWETDAQQRLVYVSHPAARYLGIPAQRLLGQTLWDLGRLAEREGVAGERLLVERRPFRDVVFAFLNAGQREIFFRLSGVPYFDPHSGQFQGYRGTAVRADSTPSERASATETELASTLEGTLLRHNDLEWKLRGLQETVGSHGEHLAGLVHELRTPLNAVAGYAELALKRSESDGTAPAALSQYLENIGEAARHMNRLIGDLYRSQVAEPDEAEQADQLPQATDLATVVRDAKAMAEMAARRKGVTVHMPVAAQPTLVMGERKALTQIVVNLLANAVKFTPEGGEVGVNLRDDAPRERPVRLAVWDTGPGIPDAEAGRIFQKGYRLERDRAEDRPSGSGLGLAIARQLAFESGGELGFYSKPGEGTVFYLDLPTAEAIPSGEDGRSGCHQGMGDPSEA